jgi:hypothetical protein
LLDRAQLHGTAGGATPGCDIEVTTATVPPSARAMPVPAP